MVESRGSSGLPAFRLCGYWQRPRLPAILPKGLTARFCSRPLPARLPRSCAPREPAKASTIHSLIYRPKGEEEVEDEETGIKNVSPTFSLNRKSVVSDAKLIVIDECSMVDEALGQDLLSFGTPVLVLGDPGQLPPVKGGGYFTEHEPDFMLEDVHRQARDNPIVDLAQQVREGRSLMIGDYGSTAKIISKADVTAELVLDTDQVLVGTNRTRRRYNERLRELKNFNGPLPQAGDKLVCLRNDTAKGLLNGSLWQVTSAPRTVKAVHEPSDPCGG